MLEFEGQSLDPQRRLMGCAWLRMMVPWAGGNARWHPNVLAFDGQSLDHQRWAMNIQA